MDGADRAPVASASTFYAPGEWSGRVELDEAAARHARVKRLEAGDAVTLTGGDGRIAHGVIEILDKRRLTIGCDPSLMTRVAQPPRIELWAPVGDRDRMLTLAEKAVELGASAWRSVVYRRSLSVTPRGEGTAFRDKLRARMISALEQSGGAWLPEMLDEQSMLPELPRSTETNRVLLEGSGAPAGDQNWQAPLTIALGPEGGLDERERAAFDSAGWHSLSLGANVLRFETAGIVALGLARSRLR